MSIFYVDIMCGSFFPVAVIFSSFWSIKGFLSFYYEDYGRRRGYFWEFPRNSQMAGGISRNLA